jgi:regulator of replication initiation timing
MEYTKLTEEQQSQLLENTILVIEQEHFANTLALRRAEATNDEAQAEGFRRILSDLETQHQALIP